MGERELIGTENRSVVARNRQVAGKIGGGRVYEKAQTSSYKISHGNIRYSVVTIVNNIILQI